jgi:aminomethyltransferase
MTDPIDLAAAEKTPLYDAHIAAGARMVPFAGYALPVQYPDGVLREHLHTRNSASLFDVSHMGQAMVDEDGPEVATLERLVPGDIRNLAPGDSRYSLLLDDSGGILDDLMISRFAEVPGRLFIVVNAGRKKFDFAHIAKGLRGDAGLTELPARALIALQGPKAAEVLARFSPQAAALQFMQIKITSIAACEAIVTRSGYTGEDGFEISVPAQFAKILWDRLVAEPEVAPAGLGARDSLRLEAGLCLYGQDIDETTNPIEAGLAWTIGKRRRDAGDFPGAGPILAQLATGPARRRVGIAPDGRAPARAGTVIVDSNGTTIGQITSGTHSPSRNAPIAMGYVATPFAVIGTSVGLVIRDKIQPAKIAAMPFVPHRYARSA